MSDLIARLNAALEGRYRIAREVGEGGMATVYLATDLRHNRNVALKVLKPELAAVVGADRFLAEIETTANLQHPHILALFDSGEADGFLFYVMPYLEGETLRERIDRERQLPVDEALGIATSIAAALQHAHDRGVIHRDIKPGNILLQDGQPVVADFGIALAVGSAGGARLTETGLSVGTPFYMSPEQATGDVAVGPASDTYALACVLYEMLVGEPPYPGNTAQAVLGKIIQGVPVSATALRKSIPLNVDAAIRKALEKLPADRFTGAQAFAKALADSGFRHGEDGASATAGAGATPRTTAALAGLAAVLALALAWSLFVRPSTAPAPTVQLAVSLRPGQVPDGSFDVSPDGSTIVFRDVSEDGSGFQLWVKRLGDLEATPLDGTSGAGAGGTPVISPDGEQVAYTQSGLLKVVPLQGGVVRTMADSAFCCTRWGEDGYLYYSSVTRNIIRVPEGGGTVEVVTTRGPAPDGPHGDLQVLPGGDVAVFTVWGTPNRIDAIRLADGERKEVTPGLKPHITPTGHLTFVSLEGQLLVAPFDAEAMELATPAVPLIEGVMVSGNAYPYYSVSESGTLLYWGGLSTAAAGRQMVWVSRTGQSTPVDPGWNDSFVTPALSRDGSRLAVAIIGSEGRDLWVKQMDQGPVARLTFPGGSDHRPWWDYDDRFILFSSERGETRDLYRKRADGVGEAELVLSLPDAINQGFFTPDGEWLIYRTGRNDALDIFAKRVSGDSATISLLASPTINEHSPTLSPDGRWLAYVSDESGRWEVYVRPFPDVDQSRTLVSSNGGSEPVWAPHGREIFYKSQTGMLTATEVSTDDGFVAGRSEELFPVHPYYSYAFHPQYDVAPDGERFLMVGMSAGSEDARLILVQNWFQEVDARLGR